MAKAQIYTVAKSILEMLESEALASHQVQKLKNPVARIYQMLEAVEQKIDSGDVELTDLMMKMFDAIFEADDLVDEAATDVAASKVRCGSICGKGITVGWRMRSEINMICEKLNQFPELPTEISSIISDLNNQSNPLPEQKPFLNVEISDWGDVIFGREGDRHRVVNALLDTSNLKDDISVVAIVGREGLGKTTVAKLVYNDDGVQYHFDLILWIHVGDAFDVREIISSIIISCSASTIQTIDGLGLDQLMTIYTENLPALTSGNSWSLFKSIAFGWRELPEHLVYRARKICEYCRGIPLVIRSVASLFHLKNEDELEDICTSLEDHLLPAVDENTNILALVFGRLKVSFSQQHQNC
ncbi:hypothetical protein BVRB_2g029050 [Beta vulgaris subsp. vulgaris]|nr:hypothetical protein BVRB_2g029050 [Beta vulgaris subsp. vulgaris]